jgi:subtilisin family serine protease
VTIRIRSLRIVLACATLLALAVPAAALAAPGERESAAAPAGAAPPAAAPERVIVVWEPGATRPERAAARDDAETALVRTLGDPRFQLLRPQAGQSVADALAALRDDPAVRVAARDSYDVPHATTNDPLFGQLWGLQNVGANVGGFSGALAGVDVNALAAWDRTRGSSSTVIADLDSGYRFDAPDLAPVAWSNPADPANGADDDGNGIVDDAHGADFVGRSVNAPATDGDPTDDNVIDGGHGVHTAGTMGAAGNNGVGISGVAQDVRIMPLRVCSFFTAPDPSDSGTVCPSSAQILAINYAGAHGARAANMSLGGPTFNATVQAALAANPQVLFVISAGNGGDDGDGDDNDALPTYPCSYPLENIVCVAAIDQADGLADFSNFGARAVDLGAPGTEILSTYPATATVFSDDFEVNDFATVWRSSGAGFGRASAGDGPLTSFGMNDSPGRAPAALLSHTVELRDEAPIPSDVGPCQVEGNRFVSQGAGGDFTYSVLLDGAPITFLSGISPSDTSGSAMAHFSTVQFDAAGHTVGMQFDYTAGAAPTAANGVWLDDLAITCNASLATPPDYGFLDGTSMAAPHVTGAAGLLFSLNPGASAAQVRSALLATVHPTAALAGRTAAGGRLDAAAALDEIRQPDTAIVSRPAGSTTSTRATFAFTRSDALLGASFECQLDGGAFAACSSPATYTVAGGRHSFAVRAKSPHGILTDPSPATATWSVLQCKVPRLKGKSLRRARRALRAAHCELGRVKRPRARRGRRLGRLVVKATKPRAGAIRPAGMRVRVTLGRKPRRRAHGRRRRR